MILRESLCVSDISVVRMISESGFFDIKPRKQCALAFRISGDADFGVNGENISSHPGDVFYMPSDMGYTALYNYGEIVVFHFEIHGDVGKAKNFTSKSSEEIYRLFLRAELLWHEKAPGYQHFVSGIFYEILGILCRDAGEEEQPVYFRNAVSDINKSFCDSSLCLSDICRNHGISETYFRRLFKQHYGKTPIEYITGLRLDYAKNLLYSAHTVEEAATMSGFSDAKYFSRVVKKNYGCTPSELKGTKLKKQNL